MMSGFARMRRCAGALRCAAWAGLLVVCLLAGCALPPLDGRTETSALPATGASHTMLGRAVAPLMQAHPQDSGIYALPGAAESFAARILLVRTASRTLDVQYYIWRTDTTGAILMQELLEAAQRGVRVRLLLDDNGISGLDDILGALDSHPGIEVRLFNPFVIRRFKMLGYLSDFSRLNRRMHNKSLTADSTLTIIGGRNIGDEYFAATQEMLFDDLDVLAAGPVVHDVSADFDRYWSSASAYPAELILGKPGPSQLEEVTHSLQQMRAAPQARVYMESLRRTTLVQLLLRGELAMEWVPVRMISDDPAKVLGQAEPEGLLMYQLEDILQRPEHSVDLVSPYFVPGAQGTAGFAALAAQGVHIRVLTNSLDSTDVMAVHAGYARYRKALLQGGVQLYEMQRQQPRRQTRRKRSGVIFVGSGSSLHAKTFAVDEERIVVGSFNLDPRSANLNTELGFVIESPMLARRVRDMFEYDVPYAAWEVELDEDGKLLWLERQRDGATSTYRSDPRTSAARRLGVTLISFLPVEWLL